MQILSELDNHVIVQYTKEEFEILRKGIEKTINYSIASHGFPSTASKHGNHLFTKSYKDLKEPSTFSGDIK